MRARPPRRHHTVPEAYLRGFARGKIVAAQRRGTAGPIQVSTSRVAVETDFYGFTIDGVHDPYVELWLGEVIDGPAARALRHLRAGMWPLEQADRDALGLFLGFQLTRTPLFRQHIRDIDRHNAPLFWASEFVRAYEARTGAELSFAQRAQLHQQAARTMPAEVLERTDPRSVLRTMVREGDREAHALLAVLTRDVG